MISVKPLTSYFALILIALSAHPSYATGCTAKIKAGTDRWIWGGDPLPYSKDIIFGAQRTERVMDGPELATMGGTLIPQKYLYDISAGCKSLDQYNGDRGYFRKWYRKSVNGTYYKNN